MLNGYFYERCVVLALVVVTVMCFSYLPANPTSDSMETIPLEEAKPFFELMLRADGLDESGSVTVRTWSDSLQSTLSGNNHPFGTLNPDDSVKALSETIYEIIRGVEDNPKAQRLDRGFRLVDGKLSLCIGAVFTNYETVTDVTACQDLVSNRLSQLVVKTDTGEIVGNIVVTS